MNLWQDEAGFIVSIELILIATIMVIGLIAGMSAVRDAVISELSDVAGAVQDLHQGYTVYGVRGHSASTAGMDYFDRLDFCDSAEDANSAIDNCITIATVHDENAAPTIPIGR
jgi:Flp pilus assembly pilin Flp